MTFLAQKIPTLFVADGYYLATAIPRSK